MGGDFTIVQDYALDKWPPGRPNWTNTNIKNFMDKFNLIDIWRTKCPNSIAFTWSNKSGSSLPRIDYWLVSESLDKDGVDVDILPTPLTDHRAIYINVKLLPHNQTVKSSNWKLNNSLLLHKSVQKNVKDLISIYWNKAKMENAFSTNWELLKFEIGKYLRKYGSFMAKIKQAEETKIITRITNLSQRHPDSLQIKPIDKYKKDICDKPITCSELTNAINHLKIPNHQVLMV